MGAGSRWGDLEFFFQIFSRKSTPGARVTAFQFCQHFANTEQSINSKRHEDRSRNIEVIRLTKIDRHLAPPGEVPQGCGLWLSKFGSTLPTLNKAKVQSDTKIGRET